MDLHLHVFQPPVYPVLQMHLQLPQVFLQRAAVPQPPLFVAHSSISDRRVISDLDNKQFNVAAIFMQSQCTCTLGMENSQTNEMGIAMWTYTKVVDTITRLTCTVISITGVTCTTGTCKAAQGVSADGVIATTTVVCCTFIDICNIATKSGFFHFKAVLYYKSVQSEHG